MKNYFFPRAGGLTAGFAVFLALFLSCATLPPETDSFSPETAAGVPVRPERPEPSLYIMGEGLMQREIMTDFLMLNNPAADFDFVNAVVGYYIEESAAEGVNHDIAFAQMILETGFLRFGGDVRPEQNNFAGLGAIGGGVPGLSFPEPRIGVRAHIQHLKGYASTEPLNQELVNPRFRYLVMLNRIGSAPTIHGLTGAWAMDPEYCAKIISILNRLFDFSFDR